MAVQPVSGIEIATVAEGWRLSCAQRVRQPLADVFPFYANARNLERLTPSFLRFRIRRVSSEPLAAGTLIDYSLRLHHLPVRWRSRIEMWDPPHRFVDIQMRGPFKTWRHTHEFRTDGGGTVIADVVQFDVHCRPLVPRPVREWLFSDLRKIFEYRRRAAERVFGEERTTAPAVTMTSEQPRPAESDDC